jgi:hypothetical protein
VVVRHLVPYYWSINQLFSLAPALIGSSKEVKAAAKEDAEVDIIITKVIP